MLYLAAAASVIIGITLGILGGGGSILTVPVLVYGLAIPTKQAIAMSLLVVGTTSLFAGFRHASLGNVCWKTAPIFTVAGMTGAFIGGYAAAWFSGTTLMVMFGVMMLTTSIFMWKGRKEPEGEVAAQPWPKIVAEGLVVGLVTGLVGAGGGFLVVPALVLLGGLQMKKAVGTSLIVIAFKSYAGFLGYIKHVEIDWKLTGIVTVGAVIGAFIGVAMSEKVPAEKLKKGFAVFVAVMAVWVLTKELILN